jgi:hypothetical protein
MNLFKRLQIFFIGKALRTSQNPFETARIKVLFNFSVFLLLSNIPYTILSFSTHKALFISAMVQNLVVGAVIACIARGRMIKPAIFFFILNFIGQNIFHFLVNNGQTLSQGVLFQTLIILITFILLGRLYGWIMFFVVSAMMIIGIYNQNSGFMLFHFPAYLADPPLADNMTYMIIIVMALNVYLVSEFVKAQGQAQNIIVEQKKVVEQKNKEITDSITYSKRIQNSLMPRMNYIEKTLKRLMRPK